MTTTAPAASILISTYNRSRLLRRAINSVLQQDFDDFEIVVIDDCSTDDTPQVVASIQDPRIRYVRNETNVGARLGDRAHVQRFVYELMQGQYFIYLCDDDYWLPADLLSRQVTLFDKNPDLAFVVGNQLSYFLTSHDSSLADVSEDATRFTRESLRCLIDLSTGQANDERFKYSPGLFSKEIMTTEEYLEAFAKDPTTLNIVDGGTLYSRAAFIRGGVFRSMDGSQWQAGYEFKLGPACIGGVAYLDEPVILTEIRSTNASFRRTQVDHYFDSIKSIETAFDVPLSDPALLKRRAFLRAIKAAAIRNVSHAFQNNALGILCYGSLSMCSEENIRHPVAPWHVAAVLWRNRVRPDRALLTSCMKYIVHRLTGGAFFRQRPLRQWLARLKSQGAT